MPDTWPQTRSALSADDPRCRAVILVEGESDRSALAVLAGRRGRDLAADGIAIVPMGGATNIGRYLNACGPAGRNLRLAGLCDAGAAAYFRSRLERAGLGAGLTPAAMAGLGFFVCDRDLEDELIRALGPGLVQEVIAAAGELPSLRRLQEQPAQRGRTELDQLHRFMGSKSHRKEQYARRLTAALDLTRVPAALDAVLAYV